MNVGKELVWRDNRFALLANQDTNSKVDDDPKLGQVWNLEGLLFPLPSQGWKMLNNVHTNT